MSTIIKASREIIRVIDVTADSEYNLILSFSDNTTKRYDFTKVLDFAPFSPLKDIKVFLTAHINYGTVVWGENDDIDIASDELYQNGEHISPEEVSESNNKITERTEK